MWCDQRCQNRGQRQHGQEDHANQRAPVAQQAADKDVFAEAAAHSIRILGSISPYRMSTARFTKTKMNDTARIAPCTTG